jgi:hypothetical protein
MAAVRDEEAVTPVVNQCWIWVWMDGNWARKS